MEKQVPQAAAPGVDVEERHVALRAFSGVPTSIAAFLGPTERGPLTPQVVTSWEEFYRWFGGKRPELSFVPDAVDGFFTNGGRRCWIARIAGRDGATAGRQLDGLLNVVATGPGAWGTAIELEITAGVPALHVRYEDLEETYPAGPEALPALAERVNRHSTLVRAWWERNPVEGDALSAGSYLLQWPESAIAAPVTPQDFLGAPGPLVRRMVVPHGATTPPPVELLGMGCGLASLGEIDEVALVAAPDEVRFPPALPGGPGPVTAAVVAHCNLHGDRFAIVSCAMEHDAFTDLQPPITSSNGACYFPWIQVADPDGGAIRLVPPSGHVAGLYARVDELQGVGRAPANVTVSGALGLAIPVTEQLQAILNPRGVNCLREFPGRGVVVWGARTMAGELAPEEIYVPVRRLTLFLEKSIRRGTEWVVFEPNDEPLWAQVRGQVEAFLFELWRQGTLPGIRPEEAYFVRCDRSTMTQNDIDNGRVMILVGFAPLRPAEFVIFRVVHDAGAA